MRRSPSTRILSLHSTLGSGKSNRTCVGAGGGVQVDKHGGLRGGVPRQCQQRAVGSRRYGLHRPEGGQVPAARQLPCAEKCVSSSENS